MTSKSPEISIILPVFNAEKYLAESITSLIRQSFQNFELIIIDDFSSDGSNTIINHFALRDNRIIVIKNDVNLGIAKSLNKGIKKSRGEIIVRHDADDIAHLNRLKIQFDVFQTNPDIQITSSTAIINSPNNPGIHAKTIGNFNHNILDFLLLFDNPIIHPTTAFRKTLINIKDGYDEKIKYAQDYELWTRLFNGQNYRLINIPLIQYRIHSNSISSSKRAEQLFYHSLISDIQLKNFTSKMNTNHFKKLRYILVSNEFVSNEKSTEIFESLKILFQFIFFYIKENGLAKTPQIVLFCCRKYLISLLRKR